MATAHISLLPRVPTEPARMWTRGYARIPPLSREKRLGRINTSEAARFGTTASATPARSRSGCVSPRGALTHEFRGLLAA
jgi:hypothetical protein